MIKFIVLTSIMTVVTAPHTPSDPDICNIDVGLYNCDWNCDPQRSIIDIDCVGRDTRDVIIEDDSVTSRSYNITLNLSWNNLNVVNNVSGYQFIELNLSNNKIFRIIAEEFKRVPYLVVLDLSYNHINSISKTAFLGLTNLATLDLSANQLKNIYTKTFSNVPKLTHLRLSENPKLYETFNRKSIDLYQDLGVSTLLKLLEINGCHLDDIDLVNGSGLEVLHLNHNNFKKIPSLPRNLRELDMSKNPLKAINSKSLPNLFHLNRLYLHDMPALTSIDDYSLHNLINLSKLEFNGSTKLTKISSLTFGPETDMSDNQSKLYKELVILNETNVNTGTKWHFYYWLSFFFILIILIA